MGQRIKPETAAMAQRLLACMKEHRSTTTTGHEWRKMLGVASDQAQVMKKAMQHLVWNNHVERLAPSDAKGTHYLYTLKTTPVAAGVRTPPKRQTLPGIPRTISNAVIRGDFDDHPKPIAQALGSMIVAKNDVRLLVDIALRASNINASEEELILRMVERSA